MSTKVETTFLLLLCISTSIKTIKCQYERPTTMSYITEPENMMRGVDSEEAEIIDAPITSTREENERPIDFNASIDLDDMRNNVKIDEDGQEHRRDVNSNMESQQRRIETTTTEIYADDSPTTFLDMNKEIEAGKKRKVAGHDHKNTVTPTYPTTLTGLYENESDIQKETNEDNARSYVDTTANKNTIKEESSTDLPKITATYIEEEETRTPVLEDTEPPQQRSPKTEKNNQSATMTRTAENERKSTRPPSKTTTKSSTLRSWIEDTWLRPPAGLLVPLRAVAINRAMAVWRDLIAEGLNVSDIIVIGFDSNGINWRSRHSHHNNAEGTLTVYEALSKLLLKYQGVHSGGGRGDGTMRALAAAAKLVPYDSALFVVTDGPAADADKLPLALKALVEKRLKVYTIWTDPLVNAPETVTALADFRKISKHTEGDILPYALQVMNLNAARLASELGDWGMETAAQTRGARLNPGIDNEHLETLLVRRGGGDASSLGVPVETGVKALRILIEGAVEHAVLYPPNDAPQIDLYNKTSIQQFSSSSKIFSLHPRDVALIFPGAKFDEELLSVLPAEVAHPPAREPTAGTWHLSVRCDTCDYRLTVRAKTLISVYASLLPDGGNKETLHLRVVGPVATVRETSIVDEYGTELAKLPFSYDPATSQRKNNNPDDDEPQVLTANLLMPTVTDGRVYVKMKGRDMNGESFVRLSGPLHQRKNERSGRAAVAFPQQYNDIEAERNRRAYSSSSVYNSSDVVPSNRATSQVINQAGALLTAVQIGLGTRIYGAPGDNLQLHFEVTNYRDQSVRFVFLAEGELMFLRSINPSSQWVGSGQMVNVVVNVGITNTAQPGARDFITFTATGLEQVSISTYVYVVNANTIVTDIWPPTLRHDFQGTCIGRQGDDCAQYAWSTTIFARDAAGGLLRLSSTPVGLTYQSNFIAGTREEVTATYRATCCAPRVMINAVDAHGNANSYVIDISNYFTSAAIAAIALGILLFIALVIVIAFLIYWCVKRRKESRELPYSTSRRDIS